MIILSDNSFFFEIKVKMADEEKVCTFIKRKRVGAIRTHEPGQNEVKSSKKDDDENRKGFRPVHDSDPSAKQSDNDDDDETVSDDDELDDEQKEMLTTQKRELLKNKFKTSILSQSTKSQKKFRKLADEKIDDAFKANRTADPDGPKDMGATATFDIDVEKEKDAVSIFKRARTINKELKEKETDDKVYRGINNYQQFYEKRDTVQGRNLLIRLNEMSDKALFT